MRPVTDRDSAEWWERVARHEFAVQECDSCGTLRFPARAYCHRCRTRRWHWRPIAPAGRVESWIVSHQPFLAGVTEPYVVVMVRLADAPECVMYGNWDWPEPPVAGGPVRAVFAVVDEELSLINWRPAE
ncbi:MULTISPECIES: Zn-ribbon domain-containing OB-fold protein [Streptosporangium]|uniref:OB-fold protein n=1 Tax=Streptosporangium brasiliense TaxID=47480 RepID=A0ABT9QW19_9ACTN|nr:OB-fold domain-containing protein [Streptosporangium brasiliense]MDP9861168.1 putative OB-fold protein [Streptosporangium brasiliense]